MRVVVAVVGVIGVSAWAAARMRRRLSNGMQTAASAIATLAGIVLHG